MVVFVCFAYDYRKEDVSVLRMINNLKAKPPKQIVDLRDLARGCAEIFGDKPVYYYIENRETKTCTYNQIWENMNRLGQALTKLDLLGKHVAVMGEVHPAYTTTYLSVVNGNGVIVPLDKEISPEEIGGFFVKI